MFSPSYVTAFHRMKYGGRDCYITLFSPGDVTAFHRIAGKVNEPCHFMSVLIVHWLVCRISEKLKLKRFYDHVNRPFDCSLAVGYQRSIASLQIVNVLSLIAMIAMKTHHCLSRYFLTCD